MSHRDQYTMLPRTPSWRKDGLLPVPADLRIESAQLAVAPIAQIQASRMADCGGRCSPKDGMVRPHSAFVVHEGSHRTQQTSWCPVAMASCTGAVQQNIFIERHLSRIFPASPRSLASVLIPRPAARRGSAFTAFRKSFRPFPQGARKEKIFRTFRKSAAWPWERGTLASLRA
jgi:hypothetical protein